MTRPSPAALRSRRLAAALLAVAAPGLAVDFPQGLVLHFGFDDAASAKSTPDLSGRGNAGRPVQVQWAAVGKKGGGADFGATGSCIAVAASPSLTCTQQTLAAWFKTTRADDVERVIVDARGPGGGALSIAAAGPDGGAKGRVRFAVGRQACLSDAALADGAWHHAAAACDGRTLRLFVDGRLQKATAEVAAPWTPGTNALTVGARRDAFEGLLDEVMVFNHALSAEQVQAVMAAARQKFSEGEVKRRLSELKELLDRGLILPEFYERKVKECQPDG